MSITAIFNFGETIRRLRAEKQVPLRTVADYLGIDQAILSKIERGQRKANRDLVEKLAHYFEIEKRELVVNWMSDKVLSEIEDEDFAKEVLQAAEAKFEYVSFQKMKREEIIQRLKNEIKSFSGVRKAWIYGSFSRKEEGPESDVDVALETDTTFSYFDLAEVQHVLEKALHRKVDVGFIDSFKDYILASVKPDLLLIYEK